MEDNVCFPSLSLFLDSPYGDVSGLPDPYIQQQQMNDGGIPMHMQQQQQQYQPQQQQYQQPQQQQQQTFEDSQDEADFASPNGKGRRIIREIIV